MNKLMRDETECKTKKAENFNKRERKRKKNESLALSLFSAQIQTEPCEMGYRQHGQTLHNAHVNISSERKRMKVEEV